MSMGFPRLTLALALAVSARALATALPVLSDGAGYQGSLVLPVSAQGDGLFSTRISVGTPPQDLWVTVDSGSSFLWIPERSQLKDMTMFSDTFNPNRSSTVKTGEPVIFDHDDGPQAEGVEVEDSVSLGDALVPQAPMMLVNFAEDTTKRTGILGLVMRRELPPMSVWDPFGDLTSSPTVGTPPVGNFFDFFFLANPSVQRTYRLEFGAENPQIVIGDSLEAGVRRLASPWPDQTDLWYVAVRAISFTGGSGRDWNWDFNDMFAYGAPALMDSGSAGIRLSHTLFERAKMAMPRECVSTVLGNLECACPDGVDKAGFPTLSISFESFDNSRYLGLDTGSDHIVCVTPSSYVTQQSKSPVCSVAIIDGGENEKNVLGGVEAIVLGVPVFKATTVTFDWNARVIGVGPHPKSLFDVEADGAPQQLTRTEWPSTEGGYEAATVVPVKAQTPEKCPCADPKNWWHTGKRLSPPRIALVLAVAFSISVYVFVAHSPNAEWIRELAGRGSQNDTVSHRAGAQRLPTNGQFMEMPPRYRE
uniref:Peptidase A1 domain-containing protein n=1 Tax=Noctiluca scintillans TaxID=2966 RepID=A0A7S0ZNI0_NOCSC|mmetsp:Transcript_12426/g.34215  ORF Transcript_12426/g.34215 Transcript_12426/m.34215 type:complete len:533 (+) Transcript_12426:48-1646(+)